jgi:hypothetical protein
MSKKSQPDNIQSSRRDEMVEFLPCLADCVREWVRKLSDNGLEPFPVLVGDAWALFDAG